MRVRPPSERSRTAVALTAAALGGVVLAGALRARQVPGRRTTAARAARNARRGAAMLAGSVLADSLIEHYRGGFHHKAMFVAPVAAGVAIATAMAGADAGRPSQRAAFVATSLTGVAGHFFHARNLVRRNGFPSWEALFYAAPIGAPGALLLAGGAGLSALRLEGLRPSDERAERIGRGLTLGAGLGLLGTTAEVALLHFRGSFHNPAMFAPVVLPPLAALAMADAVRDPSPPRLRRARVLLRATVVMGLAGTAFHAWGVHRNMGGWRNWSQNLQVAPPLPAPPSFTGVALAGLGAVDLLVSRGGR